jgi:hypothetical protein
MTDENLVKANKLKEEIDELDLFICQAKRRWTGKLIFRKAFFIFRANAYGALDLAEYNMDTETKNKVLEVLESRLKELKAELEQL